MPPTAGEIMSRDPLTLHPQDSVGTALAAMLSRKVTCAPVTDDHGHPLGLLSLYDIVSKSSGSTARTRMTSPAIVIGKEASLGVVARLLAATRRGRLVVVDREGRTVGVVTALDVVGALVHQPSAAPNRAVEEHTGLEWSPPRPLEIAAVLEGAPDRPGLFVLLHGEPEVTEQVIWAESVDSVRTRLMHLLTYPQHAQPLLSVLLQQRLLRFRTCSVEREAHRLRLLSRLLERLRSEWATPAPRRSASAPVTPSHHGGAPGR